jgi:predicted transcriptional regulator
VDILYVSVKTAFCQFLNKELKKKKKSKNAFYYAPALTSMKLEFAF